MDSIQNTLIIGDIHGCFYGLQALLDRIGLSAGDEVISIGDMVDRSPETPQVVDFFKSTHHVRGIMGNHERKHVRGARHEVKLSISQQISKGQFGPAYPEALEWMGNLPLFIQLDSAILVHGYLEPGLALEHQNPSVLCGTMGGEKILREGYDRPWYELYEAEKPIVVGHHNYTQTNMPFVYRDKVFGLDTDCVSGKALTGILLPSFQFVSVPSRGNLWLQVRRSYAGSKGKPPSSPRTPISWSETQNQDLTLLLKALQDANQRLMERMHTLPGFMEMSPRQQAKLFSELVGQGIAANLLHLTRLGKLNLDLLRTLVRDPEQVSMVINKIREILADIPDDQG